MKHKAKKCFGQNFIKDAFFLDKIIESIPSYAKECGIIEIGAGLGDLTSRLLDCGNLLAYEVDKDLTHHLLNKFSTDLKSHRLEFVFCDVLQVWKQRNHLRDSPYILVSNLPYYVATTLILKALRDSFCQDLIVMTQKEVAEKFCAKSGKKGFSPLSIITESVGEATWICDVPPQAFEPQPKVDSALFKIHKQREIVFEPLEKVIKVAFCMPRKRLFHNLTTHFSQKDVQVAFETLNLPLNIRAHELTTQDYHQLTRILRGEYYDEQT
ncbi:hypothetical protein CCZ01_08765 [Helicobacter monodelphidis]|uniref:16S rRNA (adenine(1518)-N(6)/adenine(1519)-N(6))- dimethyltransferase RsmA n=1 Tax=Helicobacter sp. 15-1451 TaxID=2004995 RepID=UPI000DCCB630|nr:16S rRNA (adenine(1518)-N(6)/adenine(1519)-N(6))-dimethyltransferase RsmA [Helicobacter sp. 15-1451]RAX56683.1 hypothetical protein CCZ01_08765 [Helicobacter sp. 15-1451]